MVPHYFKAAIITSRVNQWGNAKMVLCVLTNLRLTCTHNAKNNFVVGN